MQESSNYLFHFTDNMYKLNSILTDRELKVSWSCEDLSFLIQSQKYYNLEPIHGPNKDKQDNEQLANYALVPMTCFCDIPIVRTPKHMKVYGKYGIGFKKEWGIRCGINPVFYLVGDECRNQKQSDAASILESLSFLTTQRCCEGINITNCPDCSNRRTLFLRLAQYLKPYEGKYVKNNYKNENYRFYDEREWRFSPSNQIPNELYCKKDCENKKTTEINPIQFDINDVSIVIVDTIKDKNKVKKELPSSVKVLAYCEVNQK